MRREFILLVTAAGGKLWKLKFRYGRGIEKKLARGAWLDALLAAES